MRQIPAGDDFLCHRAAGKMVAYEFSETVRCSREGRTQSVSMPLAESVKVMKIMDELRAKWGGVYPQERT